VVNLDDGATQTSQQRGSFFAVAGYVWSHEIREQVQNLPVLSESTQLMLREDEFTIDPHVEHAVAAGGQG